MTAAMQGVSYAVVTNISKRAEDVQKALSATKHSTATGAPSGHRTQGCWVRQVDAGDTGDGLPRGFLAGAIVKVWVAHRLNWAGELLGRRGEELPRDVGSELRCLEVSMGGDSQLMKAD
jgi:hypothetical protein